MIGRDALSRSALGAVLASKDTLGARMFSALAEIRRELGAVGVYFVVKHGELQLPEPLRAIDMYVGQHPHAADAIVTALARDPRWHEQLLGKGPQAFLADDPRIGLDRVLPAAKVERVILCPIQYIGCDFGFVCVLLPPGVELTKADADRTADAFHLVGLSLAVRSLDDTYNVMLKVFSPLVWEHDARIVLDAELILRYVGGSWLDLTGTSEDDAVGMSLMDFIPLEDREGLIEWLARLSSVPAKRTVRVIHPNVGSRELEVRAYEVARQGYSRKVAAAVRAASSGHELGRRQRPEYVLMTAREREVVDLLLSGKRVRHIADELFLSEHTVRNHLKRVFRKLGVSSQAELISRFSEQ